MNDNLKRLLGRPKNNLWNNFGHDKSDQDNDAKKFNIRQKSRTSLLGQKSREKMSVSSDKNLERQSTLKKSTSFAKSASFARQSAIDGRLIFTYYIKQI